MDNIKQFGFGRGVDYLRVNFWIMYRTLFEYKINMWSAFLTQLIYIITFYVFFDVIAVLFGDVIGWRRNDFLLYFIILDTIGMSAGIFIWRKPLFYTIKGGGLNSLLVRPVNIFVGNYFYDIDSGGFFMILMNIPIIGYLIFTGPIIGINLILSFLVFVLGVFMTFFLITAIESVSFIYLGLSNPINMLMGTLSNTLNQFPYQYYINFKFRAGLFIFYSTFVAILIIPLLGGYHVSHMGGKISLMLGLIFAFAFFTLVSWHFGMKRYEAFG